MNRQEAAETLALQALAWLAGQEELLHSFMGSTGANLTDLARDARDPVFLGAVLDFLLMDDAWIIAFCDEVGLPRTAPFEARAHLPGGAQTHWT